MTPPRDTAKLEAPAPLAWAAYVCATPVFSLSVAGALAAAWEAVSLRRLEARPDIVGGALCRLVRRGLWLRGATALAWLLTSPRTPVAALVASPAASLRAATPEMVAASVRLGAPRVVLASALALAALAAVRAWSARRREGHASLSAALVTATLVVSLLGAANRAAVDLRWLVSPPPPERWERAALAPIAPPPAIRIGSPRYRRVILVLMESVGADAARDAAAWDGAARRLAARALRFDRALSSSNVSHMAQPSILTSYDYSRLASGSLEVLPSAQPTLSAPGWFRAAGYSTVMVSSQDERWLGMDRVVASQPWSVLVHSAAGAPPDALYRDACGTTKVLDSRTLARFAREVDLATGPVFGYLNLQNTHYPYVVEAQPDPRDFGGLSCAQFVSMPADRVGVAAARYRAAVRESFARVESLSERYPDALFALVGDHGEELSAGESYGHAKTLSLAQIATFFWLVGPGVSPGNASASASVLDVLPTLIDRAAPGAVDALPRGIFAGRPLRESPADDRTFFAIANGPSPEQTAIRGALQLRVVNGVERCARAEAPDRQLPLSACGALRESLPAWLRCQQTFASGSPGLPERFFNPCRAIFERGG